MGLKEFIQLFLAIVCAVFILMNIVACFHAYKFTHFNRSLKSNTNEMLELSFIKKAGLLLFGISNSRPVNMVKPTGPFETIRLKSTKEIECWLIKTNSAKGTIILFHGYGDEKSIMLDKAYVFLNLGYHTLLVDFRGSGGSGGNQTSIGFYEAKEVKAAFEYVKNKGEKNIILFGLSMGAVAVMKAQKDYQLQVSSIIIECPFGSMLQTVQARFKPMHVPSFPLANLLVFWGGLLSGFNPFRHNPIEYAKSIQCPTLLLYGEKDPKVSRKETDAIFKNLQGPKKLKLYPLAGHESYLTDYKDKWTSDIETFLNEVENKAGAGKIT
jgi:alpha-beta hydrolase superfamily lysophospholipase